jgi:MinD-like ATPase involved in chromosome partitioning or flagellar assembly
VSEPGTARVGSICTFYSYKGGVGRSMALANVAFLLRDWGHRVLVVDWDLEAPGIERYFEDAEPGVSDLATDRSGIVDIAAAVASGTGMDWRDSLIRLRSAANGTIDLLTAGRRDDQYVRRLQRLDWDDLFTEHDFGRLLEAMRDEWLQDYDYVLIDSRTGITDIGGICTIYLPDVLIALFTANRQSVDGVADVISRVRDARSGLPVDRSALVCVPVPARDESRTEYQQSAEWRGIYHERFAELYADFLPRDVTPAEALDVLRIPNVPFWSFGERLPVLAESVTDPSGISYYYALLARLIETDLSWPESAPLAAVQAGERLQAAQGTQITGRDIQVYNYYGAAQGRPGRRIWGNVPPRNSAFTGRDEILEMVRSTLLSRDTSIAAALFGMGGVGKTQVVIEYVHRFADDYDVVWWIPAGDHALIAESFAALADELGCALPGAPQAVMRRAVLQELRDRDRWLLVFDGAEDSADIAQWLPSGRGHVLITSRVPSGWGEIAIPMDIDVFSRSDSVALLRKRIPLAVAEADRIATVLGDLPLAVAQAAGFLAETGMAPDHYLQLLMERPAEILEEGRPASYPQSLRASVELSLSKLRDEDQAAAQLAEICAFLAPEPFPDDWVPRAAEWLPAPLGSRAATAVGWWQIRRRLSTTGLAIHDYPGGMMLMHRVVQAIVRELVPPDEAVSARQAAGAVLAAAVPGDPDSPATWPGWGLLLPHILALDPAAADSALTRNVAVRAARYLIRRGDAHSGEQLAARLHEHWSGTLGPDDHAVLSAAITRASGLRALGRYAEARDFDADTLARCRLLYGDDHRDTLAAANNLAEDLRALGTPRNARELDEDTLARFRRVLGEDHSATLNSAGNLAVDLLELGDHPAARELLEDTLARFRRVLGGDDPDTLNCASTLAVTYRDLGELEAAHDLDIDTLARRRRVLGYDNPETLASMNNLAADLRALGELTEAENLDRETLARRRRVLGEDHPETRRSARNLATDLGLQSEA